MNIHEHQAKQILKKYGASVPKGDFAFTVNELIEKVNDYESIEDQVSKIIFLATQ